ncbi:recombinase family protein [Massilia haematophila]|uniref:Recombinase family protein n=1 Tax=Massilia haematophila TaxID=457923 RepID=A0ABV7PQN6_9BURK
MSISQKLQAAIYVRMSTESQNYSTDHQRAKIHEYALANEIEIVKEYVDEGKSGLDIRRRAGLSNLIRDVQAGGAAFQLIIVYDVSRWGRFQDVDEAAYHEHTCRRAGIKVLYSGEQFADDGTPLGALMKSIKRTMAAEYSRELSTKTFNAQCRFTQFGYKQGGHAGYGLRRLAITKDGTPRRILQFGEAKGAVTDRVVLIPGPEHEAATVRRVYALYLEKKFSEPAIARLLNDEGVASEFGRPWTHSMVNSLLTNLKYCGTLAFNRKSGKLSSRRTSNPSEQWIVNEGAVEPLVSASLFAQARDERARRLRRYALDELLVLLRICYKTHGKVNAKIIAADPLMPDPQLFVRGFGSLIAAYEAAGLDRCPSHVFVETKRIIAARLHDLAIEVAGLARSAGAVVDDGAAPDQLIINESICVKVEIATRRRPSRGLVNWRVKPCPGADFVITARLHGDTHELIDYFLIPAAKLANGALYLKESNLPEFADIRYRSVAAIFGQ